MTDQDNLSKVKARIRALREKTAANGCTEEEAIAATEKAGELLSRYGLSEDDLSTSIFMFSDRPVGKRSPLEDIWFAAASFADCKAYYAKRGTKLYVSIFGRECDVVIAEYVFDVLKGACDRAQREFRAGETYRKRRTAKTRAQALKAFQVGLAKSIVDKIVDGLWTRYGNDAARKYEETRRSLDGQLAKQRFRQTKAARKLSRPNGAFREEATQHGVRAGRKIDVNAGVASAPREVAGLLT